MEAQFQPLTVPSVPTVIETVDVALESYLQTPASKPNLSNPDEVREAIRGLKLGKAPGPNGIPNKALQNFPCGQYSYSSKSSMPSYAPITFLQFGSKLV